VPEGPEIHGQAGRLGAFLEGQKPRLECHYEPLQEAIESLQGHRLNTVRARGKAFLFGFESSLTLYAHMQLYGRWQICRPGETPVSRRQLRLRLATPQRDALLYSATDIQMLDSEQLADHPYLSRLGPDLLDTQATEEHFLARLQDRRFQRRQLATLLLDQSFWAGPGNYLRSEILFCAGLAPQMRPCDLDGVQSLRLVRAALGLARRSLHSKGITNHPELVQRQKKEKVPRRHYRHWVFARQGLPCCLCNSPILKQDWAGRRLYLCPGCGGGGSLELDFSDLTLHKDR
jgi:endonuclease-8